MVRTMARVRRTAWPPGMCRAGTCARFTGTTGGTEPGLTAEGTFCGPEGCTFRSALLHFRRACVFCIAEMRIAAFSDIHGNAIALEAVLSDIAIRGGVADLGPKIAQTA